MKSIILPAIIFCWVGMQSGCLSLSDLREGQRINAVLREYKKADMDQRKALVDELSKKRDLATLYAICDSYPEESEESARKIVCLLSPAKGIHFCRKLPPLSKPWKEAVLSLRSHPKEKVITYFVELAQSQEPLIRATCYQACMIQPEWKELVPYALKDVDSQIPLFRYSTAFHPVEVTVGQIAKEYLDCCVEKAPLAKIGNISQSLEPKQK